MARNWAIVIGINQYRFLQPLKYAKRDAEAMNGFLIEEVKFDRIFLFTDDSPEIGDKPTEPFRANLLRVLRQIFAEPFMKDGDNFWFFFSGHGIPHNGQDYLMPMDGDPEDIENTGISTNTITNYLRNCGADNAVMILDACRSGGKKSGEGIGKRTEIEARQTGVISLFSCSPDQYSYELEAFGHGAFTYALLEALGIRGKCATVERLNQYLEYRVPELVNQHFQRVRQTPYTIAEPLDRSHLILIPKFATPTDIGTLKNDAYRAQTKQDWDLAQRLWIRVNAATSGQDMDAISALQNLGIFRNPSSMQPSVSRPFTRKQFLKWAIPVGIGAMGVTIASQFSGRSPQTASLPISNVPPSLQPTPSQSPQPLTSPALDKTPTPAPATPTPLPVEYFRLDSFLKAKDWQSANQATIDLMRLDAGTEFDKLKNFPCEILSQIDRLWVENSEGNFGFSVQKRIYLAACVNRVDESQRANCFAEQIGWLAKGNLDSPLGNLIYPGHYPCLIRDGYDGIINQVNNSFVVMKRLESCSI